MGLKFIQGSRCTYCDRMLNPPATHGGHGGNKLSATEDHYVPKCRGGRKTVLCCRQCNGLKGDMDPRDWEDFMTAHPVWWRKFSTHRDVRFAAGKIEAVRDRKGYEQHKIEIGL